MSHHYLVPMDGSELSERALPWARYLAEIFDRRVTLLRCHDPMAAVYMLPEFAAPSTAYLDPQLYHKEMDEYLSAQVEKFSQGQAESLRREGEPASIILDLSEDSRFEAVVMGSHGRGGLGRWLLGSIATKVVRGSRIPVLVINASAEVLDPPRLDSILLPLDGSEVSENALPLATSLAEKSGATLVLYHAVVHSRITNPQLQAAVDLDLQSARRHLEAVKARHSSLNIEVRVQATGADLGIKEAASQCDLVVMSSHGRSGVKRWLLGSVAEKLLQSLNKPLFVVYSREQD